MLLNFTDFDAKFALGRSSAEVSVWNQLSQSKGTPCEPMKISTCASAISLLSGLKTGLHLSTLFKQSLMDLHMW